MKYPIEKIREFVGEVVGDPKFTGDELDNIRLDVYFKLTGSRSWPDGYQSVNGQIYRELERRVEAGELVKTGGLSGGRGYRSRSRNPVRYYTPDGKARADAQHEARRVERERLKDEWLVVRTALEAKLGAPVRVDRDKPDLDLDTWQEVLRLMT